MKKKRVIAALTVFVIVGAIVAGYFWVKAKNDTSSQTSAGAGTARSAVYTVAAQDVATTATVSGTVHPLRTVTLATRAAGTITAVTRNEGDKVAAGEVIARIDSADYQTDLAAAESRYRSTMISLETAQTTDLVAVKAQLENAVTQAQTQLLSAQINLKNGAEIDADADAQTIANLQNQVTDAEENLASAQKSLKKIQDNDTSALQLEQADFSVKQAEFNLSMAQTKLATLQMQDVTDAQLTALQNQVNQAKSSLLSAQLSLQEASQSTTTTDGRLMLLQDQAEQAQASLDQAEDNLKNASADNKASQSDIDAQAMAVESAQMALTNAEANYKTTAASLADNDALSAAQLTVTKAARALATAQANLAAGQKSIVKNAANQANSVKLLEANLEQAKVSLATAQANLAAFPETQRKAELQVQSNEEAKKQALITLNQTKELADNYVITAPLAGTVTALNVAVGDTVAVGTSVATLSDVSGWYVSAYVDEVDILNVKAGQDASMTLDQYSGKTFAGTISYVSHSLGTTSNSVSAYPIRIQMTNAPSTMVDGMSADAAITVSVAKGVLAVPITAVISENGRKYVDVVSVDTAKKTATTTKTEVKTGTEGDEYIEITSGLKAGDRVLRKADTTATTASSTTSSNGGAGILGGLTGGDRVRPDDGGSLPPGGGTFTPPADGGVSSGGTGTAPGGN